LEKREKIREKNQNVLTREHEGALKNLKKPPEEKSKIKLLGGKKTMRVFSPVRGGGIEVRMAG